MSLLDRDPYNPIIRKVMDRKSIGEVFIIVREGREVSTMRHFRVAPDPKWGKRLVPYEGITHDEVEIVRI